VDELAAIPTRLSALDRCTIKRLVILGYAAFDSALPFLDDLWKKDSMKKDLWTLTAAKYPNLDTEFKWKGGTVECLKDFLLPNPSIPVPTISDPK
jgi:hypothetical protein